MFTKISKSIGVVAVLLTMLGVNQFSHSVYGQEVEPVAEPAVGQTSTDNLPGRLKDQVQEIGQTLNESGQVQEISKGILNPIYQLAEYIDIPTFYWLAFAVMVAGVVSFAFQLVFAKLLLLFKGSLNIKEILSDALGLVISLLGLVLTTQAATQNSDFPQSPLAVVSAAAVGALVGLVFYWWGQKQEFQAADGRGRKPVQDA